MFYWEVFQFGKVSNIPDFQLDKSMPETNIPDYAMHN